MDWRDSIELIFIDHSTSVMATKRVSSAWIQIWLEAAFLHHCIILLSFHSFSLLSFQVSFVQKSVLDRYMHTSIAIAWDERGTDRGIKTLWLPTIERVVITFSISRGGPLILSNLRLERTVLLNFVDFLLHLLLGSISLGFSLGFGETAPSFLLWLLLFSLVVLLAWIDFGLKGTLIAMFLSRLPNKLYRSLPLMILLATLPNFTTNGRLDESFIAGDWHWRLPRLRRLTLNRHGRFAFVLSPLVLIVYVTLHILGIEQRGVGEATQILSRNDGLPIRCHVVCGGLSI